MLDLLIAQVQQRDLEVEAKRLEEERKQADLLRAARREAGHYNISDYQQWLEDGDTRKAEAKQPSAGATEKPNVDAPRSSSRFPPPPKRR